MSNDSLHATCPNAHAHCCTDQVRQTVGASNTISLNNSEHSKIMHTKKHMRVQSHIRPVPLKKSRRARVPAPDSCLPARVTDQHGRPSLAEGVARNIQRTNPA